MPALTIEFLQRQDRTVKFSGWPCSCTYFLLNNPSPGLQCRRSVALFDRVCPKTKSDDEIPSLFRIEDQFSQLQG